MAVLAVGFFITEILLALAMDFISILLVVGFDSLRGLTGLASE
jgi:hypothetical protein